jgi:hypothetical protein
MVSFDTGNHFYASWRGNIIILNQWLNQNNRHFPTGCAILATLADGTVLPSGVGPMDRIDNDPE